MMIPTENEGDGHGDMAYSKYWIEKSAQNDGRAERLQSLRSGVR